ncbi:UNVERIFIED_CONTAM: hypothetical protein Sradi_6217300 [Sesamum radiatum]|uniref:RING-type domain-containing protein n=1 Tax=Sesamum radiatum TaxID=300843 RepID=A0AAW2KAJ8_SESRA
MPGVQEQLQEKPESTASDACSEFERGLEELMCGHYDECMSFASCSSPRTTTTEDEEDEGEQLVRRRRRSDLDSDDVAESSAARRRHSRILGRWAARQAQEMITTIERRNRESELMALAGLHTVSTRDSSFLRASQSPTSRHQENVERLSTRASSILQMWRELEDEHALGRARERLRQQRSVDSNTNESINMSGSRGTENHSSLGDSSESENDYGTWSHEQLGPHDGSRGLENSSREQSPDLGEVERERVRQIVRGWMETGISDTSSNVRPRNDSTRAEWLGETERERVRIVREWMQMTSQQRGSRSGRRGEQDIGAGSQVDHVREGFVANHEEGQPEHIRRHMLRLRGRQTLLDLLVRIERERQRELQSLLEYRAVSDFAHRNRIQSLLRGRFLRNERPVEEERPPSVAASELNQLRESHTVSGLRLFNPRSFVEPFVEMFCMVLSPNWSMEGFRSRLGTIVHGQFSGHPETSLDNNNSGSRSDQSNATASQGVQHENDEIGDHQSLVRGGNLDGSRGIQNQFVSPDLGSDWRGQVIEVERANLEQSAHSESNEWTDSTAEDTDRNWPENAVYGRPSEEFAAENQEQRQLQDAREAWHDLGSREAVGNWSEEPSDPPRMMRSIPSRRVARFHPPDDDNVYSMELRELLSRRSVSNLLRSGFRESLDQLIQSYVERQGRAPIDWDLHRNLPLPPSPERDMDQQHDEPNEERYDAIGRPSLILPSPLPPAQSLWHQDLHHLLELEMINDLRADVAKLQHGMNHMQRMLETCMDMQLELQRAVQQEVSAALNRSTGGQGAETSADGSKWVHVRKGTCCVCCDNHIDALLYRCGHMCTCSKCANELIRGGGKCPLCRAPIIEVVRAYSIL